MIARLSLMLAFALPSLGATQTLSQRLQTLSPGQWLSYEVPLQAGLRAPCCFAWSGREPHLARCQLDGRDWNTGYSDPDPPPPPGSALRVWLRRDGSGFDRVRALGTHCAIDAGTATVHEAGVVDADESLALVGADLERPEKQRSNLLQAIAYHGSSDADRVLQEASAPGRDEDLRRDAVFWLAEARGESGFRHVRAMLEREADEDLRRHEVFALSISEASGAAAELRALAMEHAVAEVRAEAIFWLAQEEDAQTETIVGDMLARESSREVREKAVFALSQLPAERAIPALRALIESKGPRDVRKQAIFWLAQVDDDAVLPVFDRLLGADSR